MEFFNSADIYHTRLNIKNHCGLFIIAVIYSRGWSYTVNNEAKFFESIHTGSVKEFKITPGPSNKTEAKCVQDKIVFKYRNILGEIIFACVPVRTYISYAVVELSNFLTIQNSVIMWQLRVLSVI